MIDHYVNRPMSREQQEQLKREIRTYMLAAMSHEEAITLLLECRLATYSLLNGSAVPAASTFSHFTRIGDTFDQLWERMLRLAREQRNAPSREDMQ